MTDTPETKSSYFRESLQAMDLRLAAEDYESVIIVADELTQRLNEAATPDNTLLRIQCLKKTAEALLKLRRFEQALDKVEEARSLTEDKFDVCSTENMDLMFLMERALNAISMLEKLGTAEAELKSALVSQYLLQTGMKGEHQAEAVVDQKTLDKLYNSALRNLEEKSQGEEVSEPGVTDFVEDLLKNKTVQAVLNQSVIWLSVAACVVGLVKMVQYTTSIKTATENPGSLSKLQKSYAITSSSKAKENELLSFKSSDGFETLSLNRGNTARYSSAEAKFKGHFIFYDGSLPSSFAAIIYSNLSPTCTFQCRGASIVSQMGTVFFNYRDSGFKLVQEINHSAQTLDTYIKEKQSLPEPNSPLLTYVNPETKQQRKIVVESVLDTDREYEPGTIILVKGLSKPDDFRLYGCDNQQELLPVERTATRWQSTLPSTDFPHASNSDEILFIFCERPFSSAVEFLRGNLWIALFTTVVSLAGFAYAIKLVATKTDSQLRTRKKVSAPKDTSSRGNKEKK